MSLCLSRLQEERKQWRKDHPFGFYAKPRRKADGGLDLMIWDMGVPGKPDTPWAGATYPITVYFPTDYPAKPPKCQFPKGFYHPNIYPSGTVCLSILNETQDWRPALNMKQVALGIQELLGEPNILSPAQQDAFQQFRDNKELYTRKVKEQAQTYAEQ